MAACGRLEHECPAGRELRRLGRPKEFTGSLDVRKSRRWSLRRMPRPPGSSRCAYPSRGRAPARAAGRGRGNHRLDASLRRHRQQASATRGRSGASWRRHVDRVVAVPAGATLAHLQQPRPDIRWRCGDIDRSRIHNRGIRDELVAGQDANGVAPVDAPGPPPRPHELPTRIFMTASSDAHVRALSN